MLLPSIFREDLLDDWMMPEFDFGNVDRKLYGRKASRLMKTDVHETETGYEVDIDLPGFKKDDIHLTLDNGYLTINASKALEEDKKGKKGKIIRQERYEGAMERSFYVGENVTEEDVRAKYNNGVLHLYLPKTEPEKVSETHQIAIEG